MDNTTPPSNNVLIIIICILLVFTILGINILLLGGNLIENISTFLSPIVLGIISRLGFVSGNVLNDTSKVLSETAKTSIDIADGTIHRVGDLLKNSTQNYSKEQYANMLLDQSINESIYKNENILHEPDSALANIQNPISIQKTRLVDATEYVSVKHANRCIAGQICPGHHMCIQR
jgi:hypothetical protein